MYTTTSYIPIRSRRRQILINAAKVENAQTLNILHDLISTPAV